VTVRVPVTVLVLAALLLAGCSAGAAPVAAWHRAGHATGRTAAPGTPGTPGTPGIPGTPGELAQWLARLPQFPPVPPPVPVTAAPGPLAPLYHRLPVTQPVAFLTIDDGWIQDPAGIALMRAANIPFTMFLIAPVAARGRGYFAALRQLGGVVEDHTVTHPELRGQPYPVQRHEICAGADTLAGTFGVRPTLFRPPFGDYDDTTLRAAHDCGMHAVLHWSETVNDGVVRYQTAEHRVQPGDVILMHFRATFLADVVAALTAIHAAGLTPALLENYLP